MWCQDPDLPLFLRSNLILTVELGLGNTLPFHFLLALQARGGASTGYSQAHPLVTFLQPFWSLERHL